MSSPTNINILKEDEKPTESIQKKINSATFEGQKELIKLGETRIIQHQIEDIRKIKEDETNNYIVDLELIIPKNIKFESYTNTMRMFKEENKDFVTKYECKTVTTDLINFGNEPTTVVKFNKEMVLDDLVHLYYGFKLAKLNIKKLEKEVEIEKESHKDTQESYNDLSKESINLEEELEDLDNRFNTYKENTIFLFCINIIIILTLGVYLFFGPSKLYNDILFINYELYNFILKIIITFDSSLTYIFDLPNFVKLVNLSLLCGVMYLHNKIKEKDLYNYYSSKIKNFMNIKRLY